MSNLLTPPHHLHHHSHSSRPSCWNDLAEEEQDLPSSSSPTSPPPLEKSEQIAPIEAVQDASANSNAGEIPAENLPISPFTISFSSPAVPVIQILNATEAKVCILGLPARLRDYVFQVLRPVYRDHLDGIPAAIFRYMSFGGGVGPPGRLNG